MIPGGESNVYERGFEETQGHVADLLKTLSSKLEIVTLRVFLNRLVRRNG